ncbi:MAG: hypothetical protein ABWY93_28485, partial [Mycobacterium sp.]
GVVEANKGTPDNPMTDDDLSEKFTDNVAPRLGAGPAAALLAALWAADEVTDFADLVTMTGRPA